MATVSEIKTNLLTRLSAAAAELSLSEDCDANEYVMRRYEEFERMLEFLKKLEVLEGGETDIPGPYEIITQGET